MDEIDGSDVDGWSVGTSPSGALTDAAVAVAGRWAGEGAAVRPLALSENAVFRVDTADGERFVLRLHRPGYNDAAEMRSEAAWVASLRAAGLPVPTPRPTLDGEAIVAVQVPAATAGAGGGPETRLVGAVEWVDGAELSERLDGADGGPPVDEAAVAGWYRSLGRILGGIRAHNRGWRPGHDFVRRHWDLDGLAGDDPLWGRFWDVPADLDAARDLAAGRDELRSRLDDLGPTAADDRYGLLHADAHDRNVLIDGDDLTLIDFDDAGFGWYVHELAVALHPVRDRGWYPSAEAALVGGYREVMAIDDDELALLPTFFAIRSAMLVGWLAARPELEFHRWLPDVIDRARADLRALTAGDG